MSHQRVTRGAALSTLGALALSACAFSKVQAAQFEVHYSDAEWMRRLGFARFDILRREGTEPAWSSPLEYEHRNGIYACAGCSLNLFSSKTKFDSGTGWPSFYAPLANAVQTKADYSLIEPRTEVHCRRCGGHLGHVFNDGPKPTGLRYCIDGLALVFRPHTT